MSRRNDDRPVAHISEKLHLLAVMVDVNRSDLVPAQGLVLLKRVALSCGFRTSADLRAQSV